MNIIDVKVFPNFLSDSTDMFMAKDAYDKSLKTYKITQLECVSGIRINANVINFSINETRKAILNDDETVIITHKKY